MSIDQRTMHAIRQDLIMGLSVHDAALKYNVEEQEIVDVVVKSGELGYNTPAYRRTMALMRIEMLSAAMAERGAEGDTKAASTYVALQKRESELLGLDQVQKTPPVVQVSLSWLEPQRLGYREGLEIAGDIAAKANAPAIEDAVIKREN